MARKPRDKGAYADHAVIPIVGLPGCELIITSALKVSIRHPDCQGMADVLVALDAYYCPVCQLRGRVSGVWICEQISTGRAQPSPAQGALF